MSKSSVIQVAIENATHETLLRPDPNYNSEVRDLVNSRPDMPKEAIQYFKKRVISRNPKIQILTLELLEYLVANTSLPFYTQVASKDFLSSLAQVYRSRDVDSQVKQKLKDMLTNWYRKFIDAKDILPGFTDIYTQLKLGAEIDRVADTRPQAFTSEKPSQNKPLPQAKADKLKADLQVVRDNISLTNDMITAGERADNETLVELINTLKAMESKLLKLLERLEDMNVMEYCLGIKDDLQNVLRKYGDLKSGKIVKPVHVDLFFDSVPEKPKVQDPVLNNLHDLIFDPVGQVSSANNVSPFPFATPSMQIPEVPKLDMFVTNPISKQVDPFDSMFNQNPVYSNPNPVFPNTNFINQGPQIYPNPVPSYSNIPQGNYNNPSLGSFTPPVQAFQGLDLSSSSYNPTPSYPKYPTIVPNPSMPMKPTTIKSNLVQYPVEEKKKDFDDLFDFKF
ncbi:hypothetical protein SteCoe_18238 [Stentor coeruleus]|uniref:VHS domain-containing protein n=1 Tax=Stentor coeruleus TaxID=5963 RepID=A0A1R2BXH4_9CILI|nr:hypothetical protein SteCoe_18238 [Stentor coeruleus]